MNYIHSHTNLYLFTWSCTHIPNIIDLSRKTKKLWSGQSSRTAAAAAGGGEEEEEESDKKIILKQYVSFRSKGRHNYLKT